MSKLGRSSILFLTAGLFLPLTMTAQGMPGAHPGYLHALSDLRYARALLEHGAPPLVEHDERWAIHEIDAAIHEIREASIDDGKDLNFHPPVQPEWQARDRFRRALEALGNAQRDIAEREDNGFARGLRNRAMGHINEAHRAVDHAIHAANWYR